MKKIAILLLLLTLVFSTVLYAGGKGEEEPEAKETEMMAEPEEKAEEEMMVDTPGVTADKILIGYTMPMSGPVGYIGGQTALGVEAVFEKYNEQGGIYGRKLELITYDSGFDPAQALANYRKLILEDEVFCILFGFGMFTRPAYPFFEEQGVPWLFPMAPPNDMMFPAKKYLFSLFPTTATQVRTMVKWTADQGKYKRLAVIYGDSASGKTGLDQVIIELEGTNVELVASEAIKNDANSAAVQVAKVAKADPDMVMIMGMVHAPAVLSVKEMKKLNLDTEIMLAMPITGVNTIKMMEDIDIEGLFGSWWGSYGDRDRNNWTPEMVELGDRLLESYPGEFNADNVTGSIEHGLSVELFVEGLKRTGKNLTREGLIEALESLEDYNTGKGSVATFSPTRREGVAGGVILQVQGGDFVPVSDWIDVELD